MKLPVLIKDGKIDINVLREEYLKAVADDKGVDFILNTLSKARSNDPLVIAYQACIETLKAKQSWNPLDKLALAKQSQETFKKAIALSPQNLEIRFLRYSIQLSLPSYLSLSKDLATDKALIIQLFQDVKARNIGDENLQRITDFMLKDEQCTSEEKAIILSHLKSDLKNQ
jgi:hypothetical protein